MDEETHASIKTDAELILCSCGYPAWLHEGKKKTCVVAISRCEGYRPLEPTSHKP